MKVDSPRGKMTLSEFRDFLLSHLREDDYIEMDPFRLSAIDLENGTILKNIEADEMRAFIDDDENTLHISFYGQVDCYEVDLYFTLLIPLS